ncbi:pentatricopeptide repeat-containing protein [Populus alba x Populus x berolinensis]|nr:pentatricopeptide repeat-containing protein [Populus alba x Populus x berolinensis]
MLASAIDKIMMNEAALSSGFLFPSVKISFFQRTARLTSLKPKARKKNQSPFLVTSALCVKCSQKQLKLNSRADENRKVVKKSGKKEHHLWQKRDSAGSGQKALNLVRIVSELPNEKEAVYGALDKWTAWETEFPLIAAAKGLKILRQRRQWTRVIQVAKWMLSKGQGATLGTYDTLLLAFDKDDRVDEAKSLWNMIIHTHTRSMSKRLFSRMISLYDHHNMQDEIIEVFADMEELGVRPDEDTVWRVVRAFKKLGQEEKRELVLERYQCKWKYIHFNGERSRVLQIGNDYCARSPECCGEDFINSIHLHMAECILNCVSAVCWFTVSRNWPPNVKFCEPLHTLFRINGVEIGAKVYGFSNSQVSPIPSESLFVCCKMCSRESNNSSCTSMI